MRAKSVLTSAFITGLFIFGAPAHAKTALKPIRHWPRSGAQQGPLNGYYPECGPMMGDGPCENTNPDFDRASQGPWLCGTRASQGGVFTSTDGDIYSAARGAQESCIEGGGIDCEPLGCRHAPQGGSRAE